jgi:hypothetical protein
MHKELYLNNGKEMISKGSQLAHGENPKISKGDREIAVVQALKAQIMDRLHSELRLIDQGEGKLWGHGQISHDVSYDAEKKNFLVREEKQEVTLGDMVADASLGCEYNISLEGVPREIAKQYVAGRAKTHLNQLLNRQLVLQELSSALKEKDLERIKRAIHFKEAEEELGRKDRGQETQPGKLFEQDVTHLLKELQYDVPELDIEVQEANIIQDMDEKIDFVVRIKDHHRGARVEESRFMDNEHEEQAQHLFGIQFTINTSEEVQKHKEKQVKKSKEHGTKAAVDDIVLITVPMSCKDIIEAHIRWRAQGCPPGGPARLYPAEIRAGIVQKVLEKIGGKKDEEERREKIAKYFKVKS